MIFRSLYDTLVRSTKVKTKNFNNNDLRPLKPPPARKLKFPALSKLANTE